MHNLQQQIIFERHGLLPHLIRDHIGLTFSSVNDFDEVFGQFQRLLVHGKVKRVIKNISDETFEDFPNLLVKHILHFIRILLFLRVRHKKSLYDINTKVIKGVFRVF